jgi:hypothetical protein
VPNRDTVCKANQNKMKENNLPSRSLLIITLASAIVPTKMPPGQEGNIKPRKEILLNFKSHPHMEYYKSLFIIRHEQRKPQIYNSKIALYFFEDQKYILQNMKITILTIRIGNIIGTPESGHDDHAHDHEKPIHHRYM